MLKENLIKNGSPCFRLLVRDVRDECGDGWVSLQLFSQSFENTSATDKDSAVLMSVAEKSPSIYVKDLEKDVCTSCFYSNLSQSHLHLNEGYHLCPLLLSCIHSFYLRIMFLLCNDFKPYFL